MLQYPLGQGRYGTAIVLKVSPELQGYCHSETPHRLLQHHPILTVLVLLTNLGSTGWLYSLVNGFLKV